jgi:hypothetical protein
MKCFSGVDVLNAVLRKVTSVHVDKEAGTPRHFTAASQVRRQGAAAIRVVTAYQSGHRPAQRLLRRPVGGTIVLTKCLPHTDPRTAKINSTDMRVPLRGIIVADTNDCICFRAEQASDIDIYKSMILAVEQVRWARIPVN